MRFGSLRHVNNDNQQKTTTMITKAELPAPYSSVEVVTHSDLLGVYDWLKNNYSMASQVVIARLGDIVIYAKLPRRNDRTYRLVFGFATSKFGPIHWDKSAMSGDSRKRWDREALIVVLLQSTIDAALALKEARRAA